MRVHGRNSRWFERESLGVSPRRHTSATRRSCFSHLKSHDVVQNQSVNAIFQSQRAITRVGFGNRLPSSSCLPRTGRNEQHACSNVDLYLRWLMFCVSEAMVSSSRGNKFGDVLETKAASYLNGSTGREMSEQRSTLVADERA